MPSYVPCVTSHQTALPVLPTEYVTCEILDCNCLSTSMEFIKMKLEHIASTVNWQREQHCFFFFIMQIAQHHSQCMGENVLYHMVRKHSCEASKDTSRVHASPNVGHVFSIFSSSVRGCGVLTHVHKRPWCCSAFGSLLKYEAMHGVT